MAPTCASAFRRCPVTSKPHTLTSPPDGQTWPSIMPMVVLFPAPLWPSRPKICPFGTSSERSSTTNLWPKNLRTFRSSITGQFCNNRTKEAPFYSFTLPLPQRAQRLANIRREDYLSLCASPRNEDPCRKPAPELLIRFDLQPFGDTDISIDGVYGLVRTARGMEFIFVGHQRKALHGHVHHL